MTLETRKIKLVQSILGGLSEEAISNLEAVVSQDIQMREILTQRALQAEKDIKEGNVFTLKDAKSRIDEILGE